MFTSKEDIHEIMRGSEGSWKYNKKYAAQLPPRKKNPPKNKVK